VPFKIALSAGEASGDNLGAALIGSLGERLPGARFMGVAGERLVVAGCEPFARSEELSVMGLAEVLPHLPRLLRLRRRFIEHTIELKPDVFVGIDSSDFNLPISASLKAAGIPTVQYVSPQVWAWRSERVEKIRAATDLVLCLLPFETDFYAEHEVNARFVGHPLADLIPLDVDRAAARGALGLDAEAPLVAILPGSRRSEVSRLSRDFLETARWLARERTDLRFAVALASETVGKICRDAAERLDMTSRVTFVTGRAREVMAAADAVLTASGTASLEALLLKRPMIVAHRLSRLTYWLARSMGVARLPNFSLPNLLAGRRVVPEFVQGQVRADILGPAMLRCLDGQALAADWHAVFSDIHRTLRRGASASAADAIATLAHARRADDKA
jgi:lipid-A-disaccharide synthase